VFDARSLHAGRWEATAAGRRGEEAARERTLSSRSAQGRGYRLLRGLGGQYRSRAGMVLYRWFWSGHKHIAEGACCTSCELESQVKDTSVV
jgi:hypothetical protein